MTATTWDHEGFYRNVIARAKALGLADSTAALARETGLRHSQLSKWYRGLERPSPKSLERLSDVLTLPTERAENRSAYPELMVLAGHMQPHQVGMAGPPTPPQVVERDPLVSELEKLLSPTSHLNDMERDMLRSSLTRAVAGFRQQRNGRRPA